MKWLVHKIGFVFYKLGDAMMDWAEGHDYKTPKSF